MAANNLDIVEAQRKYQQQLVALNSQIEDAQMAVDIVNPFSGGARIDRIMNAQEKSQQIEHLNRLLTKRKEMEINLTLIQDYINKSTR